MTVETAFETLVDGIVSGGCWPDAAPAGTPMPYATYQQVGGQTIDPINGAAPGVWISRIQLNIWSKTRLQANTLMRACETALRANPFAARPVGALIARHEPITSLRGAQQDFSVWWS